MAAGGTKYPTQNQQWTCHGDLISEINLSHAKAPQWMLVDIASDMAADKTVIGLGSWQGYNGNMRISDDVMVMDPTTQS